MTFKPDKFKDMEAYVKGFNEGSNLKKSVTSVADSVLDGASNFIGKSKRMTNSILKQFLGHIDMVLIMSVDPGFGGQKFIQNTNVKIRQDPVKSDNSTTDSEESSDIIKE